MNMDILKWGNMKEIYEIREKEREKLFIYIYLSTTTNTVLCDKTIHI